VGIPGKSQEGILMSHTPDHTIIAPDESIRRIIRGQKDLALPIAQDRDLDLDSNMIISAGAGSGKTTALIERMVALVRAGRVPEELVAITFTRQAAGELQERYFTGLLSTRDTLAARVAAGESEWSEELDRVQAALHRSEETFIGTIHSFCSRILRQFPVPAGIPPDFRQVEEADELSLRTAFWRSALIRLEEESNVDLRLLREAEIPDEALFALFSTLVEQAGVEFPPSGATAQEWADVVDRFLPLVRHLGTNLPRTTKPDEFMLAVERACGAMEEGLPQTDADRAHVLELFLTGVKRSGGTTALLIKVTYWGTKHTESRTLADQLVKGLDEVAAGRSLLEILETEVFPAVDRRQHWLHDRALSLAGSLVSEYRSVRLQQGWLTYDDLLREAARVVRDEAEARRALQEQYRHVLVDEFQDTDPEQAALLFHLCATRIDPDDWSRNSLLSGRLFVVGDDKQSIYRFRKADFQAFALICQAIRAQGGRHLTLSANFRSDARVCSWVNQAMRGRFEADGAAHQARWENLQPHKGRLHDQAAVVRLAVGQQHKGNSDKPRTVAEARAIARMVKTARETENVPFGDWLLLVRSHTRVPILLQVLSEEGLPVALEGGKGDQVSDVLAWVHDLLGCLTRPEDGAALAAVLTGPCFGLSDKDLLGYRRCGGDWKGHLKDVDRLENVPTAVLKAASTLQTWATSVAQRSPLVAWERVLAESGLAGALRLRSDGDVCVGMLELIGQLISDWQQRGLDMAACVRELGRYRAGDLKLGLYSDNVPFQDSVRIMTIHGSKGLQARRVVLADASANRQREPELHVRREGNRLVGWAPVRSHTGMFSRKLLEPQGWDGAVEEERRFERGEEGRLLYVAATRAIEQLVVCTHNDPDKAKGTWDEWIPYLMDDDIPVVDVQPGPEDVVPAFGLRNAAPAGWPAPKPGFDPAARIAALSRSTWRIERPSDAAEDHASGRSLFEGEPLPSRSTGIPGDGRALGSAWHTLFEALAAFRKVPVPEIDTVALIAEVQEAAGPEVSRVLSEQAPERIRAFLRSDLWRQLAVADRVLTEVPFTTARTESEETVLWSGIVDLAFLGPDGWTIVDYKSDRADEETIRKRHASQIRAYVQAWESLFDGAKPRGVIWSTHLDRALSIIEPAAT
jgi:ATP-dependent helicase/nuclease subunit A